MALNTFKCNCLIPLQFKGFIFHFPNATDNNLDEVRCYAGCPVAGEVRCHGCCDQFFSEQPSAVTLNLEGIHVVSMASYFVLYFMLSLELQCFCWCMSSEAKCMFL